MAVETLMKNKREEEHEDRSNQKLTYQAHPPFFPCRVIDSVFPVTFTVERRKFMGAVVPAEKNVKRTYRRWFGLEREHEKLC